MAQPDRLTSRLAAARGPIMAWQGPLRHRTAVVERQGSAGRAPTSTASRAKTRSGEQGADWSTAPSGAGFSVLRVRVGEMARVCRQRDWSG